MNFVKSIKLSLKYHRFTPSGFKLQDLENLSLRQKLNSFLPDRINPGHIDKQKQNQQNMVIVYINAYILKYS